SRSGRRDRIAREGSPVRRRLERVSREISRERDRRAGRHLETFRAVVEVRRAGREIDRRAGHVIALGGAGWDSHEVRAAAARAGTSRGAGRTGGAGAAGRARGARGRTPDPGIAVAAVVRTTASDETGDENTREQDGAHHYQGGDDISPGPSCKRRRPARTTASGASSPIAASRN